LIEQIFTASGSSIDILNDLLIYEHIDSGRRTQTVLVLSVQPFD
jgi:hypothetical protein